MERESFEFTRKDSKGQTQNFVLRKSQAITSRLAAIFKVRT